MVGTCRGALLILCLAGGAPGAVDFETEVLPILQAKCIKCHGDEKQKGDLSLEARDIGRIIGDNDLIWPGEPKKSALIKALTSDGEDRMPPKGGPIGKAQIEVLTRWVQEGASLRKGGALVVEGGRKPLAGKWTNTEGKVIEAELVKVEKGNAVLRLANGKLYNYPLEKLDEESRQRAEEWAKGEEGE